MVHEFEPRFDLLPGAQCIHGQVHPGNVLFDDSGSAILLDWEEAVYTFAPPDYDLAYFVQRFCLRGEIPDDNWGQLLSTVESVYGKLPPVAGIMRQLAWFSIAAIVDFSSRGMAVGLSEYQKFVRLEQQARALVGVV
jgi:thiamine kinase-like enzyme